MSAGIMREIFDQLLRARGSHVPSADFMANRKVKPHMRQRLADWLLEVAQVFRCERETFVMAMVYIDRYITAVDVEISKFQLVGATALLMASKLICVRSIHLQSLCTMMQNVYSEDDVKAQELEMLNVLNWQLEVIKPHDLFELMLRDLPLAFSEIDLAAFRRHGDVYIDMCYTEASFMAYGPVVVAAAALYLSICSSPLSVGDPVPSELRDSLLLLPKYFDNDDTQLRKCITEAHELFLTYELAAPEIDKKATNPSPARVHDLVPSGRKSSNI